jgi:hypothetical protein
VNLPAKDRKTNRQQQRQRTGRRSNHQQTG